MVNKVKPITPDEAKSRKVDTIPDAALEAFNELITQKLSGGVATFTQREVVALMESKGLDRDTIYAQGCLNIEALYRVAGWEVYFDKPGYNESYEAYFKFVCPKNS